MKITKRDLIKIIKEEKKKLNEGAYIHDIFSQAAAALSKRDGEALEDLSRDLGELMMDEREQSSYREAIEAMAEAAYELYEYGDGVQ